MTSISIPVKWMKGEYEQREPRHYGTLIGDIPRTFRVCGGYVQYRVQPAVAELLRRAEGRRLFPRPESGRCSTFPFREHARVDAEGLPGSGCRSPAAGSWDIRLAAVQAMTFREATRPALSPDPTLHGDPGVVGWKDRPCTSRSEQMNTESGPGVQVNRIRAVYQGRTKDGIRDQPRLQRVGAEKPTSLDLWVQDSRSFRNHKGLFRYQEWKLGDWRLDDCVARDWRSQKKYLINAGRRHHGIQILDKQFLSLIVPVCVSSTIQPEQLHQFVHRRILHSVLRDEPQTLQSRARTDNTTDVLKDIVCGAVGDADQGYCIPRRTGQSQVMQVTGPATRSSPQAGTMTALRARGLRCAPAMRSSSFSGTRRAELTDIDKLMPATVHSVGIFGRELEQLFVLRLKDKAASRAATQEARTRGYGDRFAP